MLRKWRGQKWKILKSRRIDHGRKERVITFIDRDAGGIALAIMLGPGRSVAFQSGALPISGYRHGKRDLE
jgi:hypothetical protein